MNFLPDSSHKAYDFLLSTYKYPVILLAYFDWLDQWSQLP